MTYRYEWDISVASTDFSGRIYTPEVIDCMARAYEAMMGSFGYGPKAAYDEGVVYPVAHIEADYLQPIGLDDTVVVSLDPTAGNSSVTVDFDGIVGDDHAFEGSLTSVFVDEETGETVSLPASVESDLASL